MHIAPSVHSIPSTVCVSIQQGSARSLRARRRRARRIFPPTREPIRGDNTTIAMKSVVVDPDVYDWEGDAPLRRPFATTVIYEMHVAGFTRHPSSGVAAGAARDLCGHDREDPIPPGSRDHRRRTASGVPVRPRRTARRAWSITGGIPRSRSSLRMPATVRGKTRSARSTSSAISSRRCTAPASR